MKNIKRNLGIIIFILPALLLYVVFLIYPMSNSILLSLYKWNGANAKVFIGFQNFLDLASDKVLLKSIWNTARYLVLNILFQMPIALILAMILCKKIKGYKFFRTVYFLPYVIAQSVIAMMFLSVFNPQFGMLNDILKFIGGKSLIKLWLVDPKYALNSVVFVVVWKSFGYYMVIMISGILSIPKEIYEAAEIDGANGWQRETRNTLPFLWPFISICVTLASIGGWKGFDMVWVMTQGGVNYSTELMATYMYRMGFLSNSFGYSSAVATLIFVFCILSTIILNKIFRKVEIQY